MLSEIPKAHLPVRRTQLDRGMSAAGKVLEPRDVARFIQHTLIRIGTTREEIVAHCHECVEYGFDAAMVPGRWVPLASDVLSGAGPKVVSAVDFPIAAMSTSGRAAEASALAEAGAEQLDVGVAIGWLRSGMFREFHDDIAAVVRAVEPVPVKVMLELPLLNPDERDLAVDLAVDAGVAFVKNASSRSVGVATPDDIRFLRRRAPSEVGVKASGGIRSFEQVVALLDAGADLVGTSAGVAIVTRAG